MRHQDGLLALNEQKNSKFWAKVDRTDLFACWDWTGGRSGGNGYGMTSVGGEKQYAHRIAYELSGGTIPDDLNLLHRCNNKLCCNPLHHYTGDQLQNAADAKRAGAMTGPKLTPSKARQIAAARKSGLTYVQLADKFGISAQSIGKVCRGETWSDATGIKPKAAKPATKH
jgi:hypothetical protein